MKTQKSDIVIDRLGTHLFKITRKDGTNSLSWDWNKLLEEVREATSLLKVTETKVKRTRKKKEA